MDAKKGNVRHAGHVAPAKKLTKYAADFIARCELAASNETGLFVLAAVLVLQAVLMLVLK